MKIQCYEGGSIREDKTTKPHYTWMPMNALRRVGDRYMLGNRKYGVKDDYKKGMSCMDCMDAIFRHAIAYMEGDNKEDHLAAVVWNANAIMYFEENRPKFQDIPSRKGVTNFDYNDMPVK